MSVRRFDEDSLREQLEALPRSGRVAFAAACAERLLPAYAVYLAQRGSGDSGEVEGLLDLVWRRVLAPSATTSSDQSLVEHIERCMERIPKEDDCDDWLPAQGAAEDAVAAVAYALRCLRVGTAQEAAWAARRGYEAMDCIVMGRDESDTSTDGAEMQILSDPLIQSELARQERDLRDLMSGLLDEDTVDRLRARAQLEGRGPGSAAIP